MAILCAKMSRVNEVLLRHMKKTKTKTNFIRMLYKNKISFLHIDSVYCTYSRKSSDYSDFKNCKVRRNLI